jgi:hypothetical protein
LAGTESAGLFRSSDDGLTWQRVLECDEAVHSLLFTPASPTQADILAVTARNLWLSHNGGQSWETQQPDIRLTADITAAAAPAGYTPQAPLLLGLADGRIVRA